MEPTGTLTGFVNGLDGDDLFEVTPGPGTILSVFGGNGNDQLTVDAGSGLPLESPGMITVIPGGATVTHTEVETIIAICDTCATLDPLAAVDAGHHASSDGLRMGFLDMLRPRNKETRGPIQRHRAVDAMFANWDGSV